MKIKQLTAFLFICFSASIFSQQADTQTVTAVKNNHTDKVRFFNNNNTLTITITESGNNRDSGRMYYLKAAFSSSDPGATSSIAYSHGGWIDMQSAARGGGIIALGSDYAASWTITLSHLTDAHGGVSPNGKYVDFAVVQTGDDTPTTGESTLVLVNDVDGNAAADNLLIDSFSILNTRDLDMINPDTDDRINVLQWALTRKGVSETLREKGIMSKRKRKP